VPPEINREVTHVLDHAARPEVRSELHDLAAAGAGRRRQVGYAARLLVRAVPLRAAVLAPRRGKASL
jgi:hypothetical protein